MTVKELIIQENRNRLQKIKNNIEKSDLPMFVMEECERLIQLWDGDAVKGMKLVIANEEDLNKEVINYKVFNSFNFINGEKKEVSFVSFSTKDKFLNFNLMTQKLNNYQTGFN